MPSIHPDPSDDERRDYVRELDTALGESIAELTANPPADPEARKLAAAHTLTRLVTLDAPACCNWTIDSTGITGQLAHSFGDDFDEIRRQLTEWAAVLTDPEFVVEQYTAKPTGKVAVNGTHGNVRVQIWDGWPDVTGLTAADISAAPIVDQPAVETSTANALACVLCGTTDGTRQQRDYTTGKLVGLCEPCHGGEPTSGLGHVAPSTLAAPVQPATDETASAEAASVGEPIIIELDGLDLHKLIGRVLPHDDDRFTGSLHIEVSPDALIAASTDRYTLGVAHHQVKQLISGHEAAPFTLHLPAAQLAAFLQNVDTAGSYVIELTPTRLTIDEEEVYRVTLESCDADPKCCDWRSVLRVSLALPASPGPVPIAPALLQRVVDEENPEPLVVRVIAGDKDWKDRLIITQGSDFLALVTRARRLPEAWAAEEEALVWWRALAATGGE